MRELWLSTLRTRALRPVPLGVGVGLLGLGLAFAVMEKRLGALPVVLCLYALVVANGLVGEDVRDGTVPLVLARPITRARYLGARLLGALTATLAFAGLSLAAGAVIARPDADALASVAVAGIAAAIWTVVLVFFFSTILPGRADVLAVLGLFLALGSLSRAAITHPVGARVMDFLRDNFFCVPIVLGGLFTPAAVTDLLRWASNVALLALAAVLIFNRRQFGYAD